MNTLTSVRIHGALDQPSPRGHAPVLLILTRYEIPSQLFHLDAYFAAVVVHPVSHDRVDAPLEGAELVGKLLSICEEVGGGGALRQAALLKPLNE